VENVLNHKHKGLVISSKSIEKNISFLGLLIRDLISFPLSPSHFCVSRASYGSWRTHWIPGLIYERSKTDNDGPMNSSPVRARHGQIRSVGLEVWSCLGRNGIFGSSTVTLLALHLPIIRIGVT